MTEKIRQEKVPGVSNPDAARSMVRKGSVTYRQAGRIAKAGNLDSIRFDAKTQVHGIAVRLERAPEVCEQTQSHVLRTRNFVVMEEKQFLYRSAYLPEVTLDRPALLVVNYRHRRFIGLNVVSIHLQVTYSVIERPRQVSDILEPVVHGGRWNVHPETLHYLYLPVERKTANYGIADMSGDESTDKDKRRQY